jgi:hypothetical protein
MVDKHSPRDTRTDDIHSFAEIREAHDAESHHGLSINPSDANAKLDIGLDESFPTSDPPAQAQPGSTEPAPSSGYDEVSEAAILRRRARNQAIVDNLPWLGLAVAGLAVGLIAVRMLAPRDD